MHRACNYSVAVRNESGLGLLCFWVTLKLISADRFVIHRTPLCYSVLSPQNSICVREIHIFLMIHFEGVRNNSGPV